MSLVTNSPAAAQPPVIALHASAGSSRQWRHLADALAARHRVHAIDLHEHGGGPAWTAGVPLTLEDEATLVAPLLAAAGPVAEGGGAHLVGHSYGGAVALKVAALYPRHVRSLVVFEPVAFRLLFDDAASHAETDEIVAFAAAVQTALEHGDRLRAGHHFIDYWSGCGAWAALPAAARDAVAARMPAVLQHFGAVFNERQQVRDVARLALPMLALRGEHAPASTRRVAERLRALWPSARHETLPAMGHMGPVTHAAAVNERIGAFLQSLTSLPAPQAAPAARAAPRFPTPPEINHPGSSVLTTTLD
jgi:pimeloyl-ACP methyl ester carboxylesterase